MNEVLIALGPHVPKKKEWHRISVPRDTGVGGTNAFRLRVIVLPVRYLRDFTLLYFTTGSTSAVSPTVSLEKLHTVYRKPVYANLTIVFVSIAIK